MSKEITCRMINGKPVVEYKEEYFPKKGDIVKISVNNRDVIAVHDKYNHYQAVVVLSIKEKNTDIKIRVDENLVGVFNIYRKATPEECEVMHHILNENGYELKGDTVVKKRWIPKMGDVFYFVGTKHGKQIVCDSERGCNADGLYLYCFKTEAAAQSACDKMNELLLSLPQE